MSHLSVRPISDAQFDLLEALENLTISGTNQGIAKTSATTFANVTFSGGSGTITGIGTIDSVSPKVANGAQISGANIILQTADDSFPGLVSIGTQTFAGTKTFPGIIVTPTSAATTDLILNGIASKTGDYLRLVDSNSAVLGSWNYMGFLGVGLSQKMATFSVQQAPDFTAKGTTTVNGSQTVIGVGTDFLNQLSEGDSISVNGGANYTLVVSVNSATSLTVNPSIGVGGTQTILVKKQVSSMKLNTGANVFRINSAGRVSLGDITGVSPGGLDVYGNGTGGGNPFQILDSNNGNNVGFIAGFISNRPWVSLGLATFIRGAMFLNASVTAAGNSWFNNDAPNTIGAFGIKTTQKLSQFTVTGTADFVATGTTSSNASSTLTGTSTDFFNQLGIDDRLSYSSAAATYAWVNAIASSTSATLSTTLGNGTSQTINVKKSLFGLNDANSNRVLSVDPSGHLLLKAGAGTTSVAINAGTASLSSGASDHAGKVTATNTGASVITITFANPFQNPPSAFAYNETTPTNKCDVSTTGTALVITCATVSGDVINYGVLAS